MTDRWRNSALVYILQVVDNRPVTLVSGKVHHFGGGLFVMVKICYNKPWLLWKRLKGCPKKSSHDNGLGGRGFRYSHKRKFLKQIGFDPGDLTYSFWYVWDRLSRCWSWFRKHAFFCRWKVVIFDHFADMTRAKNRIWMRKSWSALKIILSLLLKQHVFVLMSGGKLDGKRRLVKTSQTWCHGA